MSTGEKLLVRQHNERVKLAANTLAAISIGGLVAAVINPDILGNGPLEPALRVVWSAVAIVLFIVALAVLGLLKLEA